MTLYSGDVPAYFALQNHDVYLEVIKSFNNIKNDIQKIKFVFGDQNGIVILSKSSPNFKKILLKNKKIFYNAIDQCFSIFHKFGIILENVECIKSLSHLVFPQNLKTFDDLNYFLNKEGLMIEQGFENIALIRNTIQHYIEQNSLRKQARNVNGLVDLAIFLKCNGYSIENVLNHGFKRNIL